MRKTSCVLVAISLPGILGCMNGWVSREDRKWQEAAQSGEVLEGVLSDVRLGRDTLRANVTISAKRCVVVDPSDIEGWAEGGFFFIDANASYHLVRDPATTPGCIFRGSGPPEDWLIIGPGMKPHTVEIVINLREKDIGEYKFFPTGQGYASEAGLRQLPPGEYKAVLRLDGLLYGNERSPGEPPIWGEAESEFRLESAGALRIPAK